jgi:hypothetical protein
MELNCSEVKLLQDWQIISGLLGFPQTLGICESRWAPMKSIWRYATLFLERSNYLTPSISLCPPSLHMRNLNASLTNEIFFIARYHTVDIPFNYVKHVVQFSR